MGKGDLPLLGWQYFAMNHVPTNEDQVWKEPKGARVRKILPQKLYFPFGSVLHGV